jgi:histidinol-phosphate/aromatic aminotransferase/cobyric acid decarboxylase-like protein
MSILKKPVALTRRVVDFSLIVNPLGPPLEVRKALGNLDFSSYPDIENLVLREQRGLYPKRPVM